MSETLIPANPEIQFSFDENIDHEDYEALVKENFVELEHEQLITGTVTQVNEDFVTVDFGYKSQGQILTQEFRDCGENPQVGERVEVFLEKKEDERGQVLLSKDKANRLKVWEKVNEIHANGGVIEGKIIAKVKGGLNVDIGIKAFLPGSQIDLKAIRDLDSLLGETYEFIILKTNQKRGNIVLSRRALLEIDREDKRKKTIEQLQPDQIIKGYVKNITDYGLFVDLGGIDGLLHVTDMTWGRILHPTEMYQVGDEIEVIVLSFDRETEKVSLGLKQKNKNPWDEVKGKYPEGSRIVGKVVSLTNYGAFVEIEEGVEGLIHISEMSWTKKIKQPSALLQVGDLAKVAIKEIDVERRRISLSMKDALPNPWYEIQDKMPVDSVVTGLVRNITEFGVFVSLEGGIDGLIHVSDISWSQRIKKPEDLFTKNQEIDVKVLAIDPEKGRLSLGVKQLTTDPWTDLDKQISEGDVISGKVVHIADFGVFVEIKEGVEGLIHISEIGKNYNKKTLAAKFEIGGEIYARVIKLDLAEKRLGLATIDEKIADDLQQEMETGDKPPSDGQAPAATEAPDEATPLAESETPENSDSSDPVAESDAPENLTSSES